MSKTKARERAKARAAAKLANPGAAKEAKPGAKRQSGQFDAKSNSMRNVGGTPFSKTVQAVRRGASRSR